MDLPSSEWRVQANWSGPKCLNFLFYWRASEASETLTGVTQFENLGYLFVYYNMFGCMYVI